MGICAIKNFHAIMNLHLCLDGNFIPDSMKVFEQYYPNQNIFVMFNLPDRKGKYIENVPIFRFDSKDKDINERIDKILDTYSVDKIIMHALFHWTVPVMCYVKQRIPTCKCFWLFWGFDMYEALAAKGKYKLVDSLLPLSRYTYITPSLLNSFIVKMTGGKHRGDILDEAVPYIDYFCFWFKPDFELLKKHYDCNIQFKYFQYIAARKDDHPKEYIEYKKISNRIMVNHQASRSGNHLTVLKKLKTFGGIENYEIWTPLSYGMEYVKELVLPRAKRMFGEKFKPLLELMPFAEYNDFLNTIPVAIFGQLRQEAAGNIMQLLASGAKVFLRDGNPLQEYYKTKGYIIFSFEKDLNSIADLTPLTAEQQKHNIEIANCKKVLYDDFMPALLMG